MKPKYKCSRGSVQVWCGYGTGTVQCVKVLLLPTVAVAFNLLSHLSTIHLFTKIECNNLCMPLLVAAILSLVVAWLLWGLCSVKLMLRICYAPSLNIESTNDHTPSAGVTLVHIHTSIIITLVHDVTQVYGVLWYHFEDLQCNVHNNAMHLLQYVSGNIFMTTIVRYAPTTVQDIKKFPHRNHSTVHNIINCT